MRTTSTALAPLVAAMALAACADTWQPNRCTVRSRAAAVAVPMAPFGHKGTFDDEIARSRWTIGEAVFEHDLDSGASGGTEYVRVDLAEPAPVSATLELFDHDDALRYRATPTRTLEPGKVWHLAWTVTDLAWHEAVGVHLNPWPDGPPREGECLAGSDCLNLFVGAATYDPAAAGGPLCIDPERLEVVCSPSMPAARFETLMGDLCDGHVTFDPLDGACEHVELSVHPDDLLGAFLALQGLARQGFVERASFVTSCYY